MQYYAYFAYLLLKGQIFSSFTPLQKHFSDSLALLLDDTNLTQKVTRMLSCLQRFDIDTKEKLTEMWQGANQLFLQDCVCLWIKDNNKIKEVK
jgi:hypothetical protein